MIKIGTAPDSWGVWYPNDDKQVSWDRYLDEIIQAGYHLSELGPYGYMPTDVPQLLKELNSREISICAGTLVGGLKFESHRQNIISQVTKMSELLNTIGAEYFIIMDESENYQSREEARLTQDEWNSMIALLQQIQEIVNNNNLQLLFHPHVGTCVETEEETIKLLHDININLCFDTGHHIYVGKDPFAFIENYSSRIPYLHIKNMDAKIRKQIDEENIHFAQGFQMGVMCELDKGVLDFLKLRDILHRINFDGYCIVEQDVYPAPLDKPLPIAKHNLEYLQNINFTTQ